MGAVAWHVRRLRDVSTGLVPPNHIRFYNFPFGFSCCVRYFRKQKIPISTEITLKSEFLVREAGLEVPF